MSTRETYYFARKSFFYERHFGEVSFTSAQLISQSKQVLYLKDGISFSASINDSIFLVNFRLKLISEHRLSITVEGEMTYSVESCWNKLKSLIFLRLRSETLMKVCDCDTSK